MNKRTFLIITLGFALIGILDAGYLTMEHYSNSIPPCSTSIWVDCGRVLKSPYAMIGPIPVAVLGLTFYTSLFFLLIARLSFIKDLSLPQKIWLEIQRRIGLAKRWGLPEFLQDLQLLMVMSAILFSAYFVYLQLGVIRAICLYCMVSAVNSLMLASMTVWERRRLQ